jgi:hypothetical protein
MGVIAMDVFISWSSKRSRKVADFLFKWLKKFPLKIEPWVSGEAIEPGTRWNKELDEALKETNFGILCITKDNQREPWICFEAGALAKAIEKSNVIPYLIDMSPGELEYPLKQFHAIEANKDNTLKLIKTIHKVSGDMTRSEIDLIEVFDKWWPDLEAKIDAAKKELPETEIIKEEPSPVELKAGIDKILNVLESLSSRLIARESKSVLESKTKYPMGSIAERLERALEDRNTINDDKDKLANIIAKNLIKKEIENLVKLKIIDERENSKDEK